MHFPRMAPASSLLADGRVLVSGGYTPNTNPYDVYTPTAEIFDPAANSWSVVASMNIHRVWHVSIRLQDGRVMAAGGANYAKYEETAEIYDATANMWTLVPSMSTQRYAASASLLSDGRVMVAGGAFVNPQSSVDIYNPGTNQWSQGSAMSTPRYFFTLTGLTNGTVVAAGGSTGTSVILSTETYDPIINTWSVPSQLNSPRYLHAATQLRDGRLLVVGGYNGSAALASTEILGIPDDDSLFAKLNNSNTFTGSQTINGSVTATTFAGDGSRLTNVTAAYATQAVTAGYANSAGNALALGGALPSVTPTPSTIAARDNAGDLFANVFHGSGASLVNIPATALPNGLVYDNQANSLSGTQTIKGQLQLAAIAQATGTPSASQTLNLQGWDGTNPTIFQWLVTGTGKLDLQTATGGNPPADSGLTIAPNGVIAFAAGQTFPGAQTALTAGAGIGINGTTISNTGVLSVRSGNPGINVGGVAGSPMISNSGVLSFNGRTGATGPTPNDYSFAMIAGTLTPAQVAPGTYAININGNATTATTANASNTATTANLAGNANALGGVSPGNYARLDIGNSFTGNQNVAGNMTTSGNVSSAGSLTIGNGEPITHHFSHLFQNVTFNQVLTAGACVVLPAFSDPSLAAASDSDTVVVALPDALIGANQIVYAAWAGPTTGIVNVRLCNPTGMRIALAATGNVRIDVWKH